MLLSYSPVKYSKSTEKLVLGDLAFALFLFWWRSRSSAAAWKRSGSLWGPGQARFSDSLW